jgi:hypothetical protein
VTSRAPPVPHELILPSHVSLTARVSGWRCCTSSCRARSWEAAEAVLRLVAATAAEITKGNHHVLR